MPKSLLLPYKIENQTKFEEQLAIVAEHNKNMFDMTKESLKTLEILKKDIIRQIEYDSVKIVRMEQKLKEIELKILTHKND